MPGGAESGRGTTLPGAAAAAVLDVAGFCEETCAEMAWPPEALPPAAGAGADSGVWAVGAGAAGAGPGLGGEISGVINMPATMITTEMTTARSVFLSIIPSLVREQGRTHPHGRGGTGESSVQRGMIP